MEMESLTISQPTRSPVALGSDHAGWPLKEDVKSFLRSQSIPVEDYSLPDGRPADYTDIGLAVAGAVARGEISRAILICGTGLGMTILANKLAGIRACLCHEGYAARMSRAHNDCNVLVLGGRVTGPELAKEIVSVWLNTDFEGGRHERRLSKISEVERTGKIEGDQYVKPVAG